MSRHISFSSDEFNEIRDRLDDAELIGEGGVEKGARYVVYKLDSVYYAVILLEPDRWVEHIEEIDEEEIDQYI